MKKLFLLMLLSFIGIVTMPVKSMDNFLESNYVTTLQSQQFEGEEYTGVNNYAGKTMLWNAELGQAAVKGDPVSKAFKVTRFLSYNVTEPDVRYVGKKLKHSGSTFDPTSYYYLKK